MKDFHISFTLIIGQCNSKTISLLTGTLHWTICEDQNPQFLINSCQLLIQILYDSAINESIFIHYIPYIQDFADGASVSWQMLISAASGNLATFSAIVTLSSLLIYELLHAN